MTEISQSFIFGKRPRRDVHRLTRESMGTIVKELNTTIGDERMADPGLGPNGFSTHYPRVLIFGDVAKTTYVDRRRECWPFETAIPYPSPPPTGGACGDAVDFITAGAMEVNTFLSVANPFLPNIRHRWSLAPRFVRIPYPSSIALNSRNIKRFRHRLPVRRKPRTIHHPLMWLRGYIVARVANPPSAIHVARLTCDFPPCGHDHGAVHRSSCYRLPIHQWSPVLGSSAIIVK